LGIAKLPLIGLKAETEKEFELRLLPSLDTLKVKDKKDRGTLTLKVQLDMCIISGTILDIVVLYICSLD